MTPAVPARALMSIGEVLAALRPEFPDVTISKIRFLESEGLVEPARTPSGYRKFSATDLERLVFVLAAQRDHYLPLRVIKEQLNAIDRGEVPDRLAGPRALDAGGPRRDTQFSRAELIEAAGIDEHLLDQLESYDLVTRRRGRGGTTFYDEDALTITKIVTGMSAFGLEPRHLRAFHTAAERETSLVEQVVAPLLRQRSPQARARAEEVARELTALSVRLHTALVRAEMRSVIGR